MASLGHLKLQDLLESDFESLMDGVGKGNQIAKVGAERQQVRTTYYSI